MTALFLWGRPGLRPLLRLVGAFVLIATASPARSDDPIVVRLDQARIVKIPDRAATLVIGNPLIADASIQPGALVVITGKGYGATNLIALDRAGAVLMEKDVEVTGPSDPIVIVYRGATRQTYSCMPDCQPRIAPGDTGKDEFDDQVAYYKDFFKTTVEQSATRNNQALAGGAVR
jgi:hypothetical protein